MKPIKQQGFTLIEMVMVIVILGIITATSSLVLLQGYKAFYTGTDILDAFWQGQIAMQRMTRDIRGIRSPSDISGITGTSQSSLTFTDANGNSIVYSLSGSSLLMSINGASPTPVLADGVQSLTFSFFDGITSATSSAASINYIRIALTINQNNTSYSLTTAVYPRNTI